MNHAVTIVFMIIMINSSWMSLGIFTDLNRTRKYPLDNSYAQRYKMGKKRKKNEKSPVEIALLVDNVMAWLEVTNEVDVEFNRQGKPTDNKLKKLPLLTEVLSKKQLQKDFLDHGVLTLLKNWLEPLPDRSLPNINICSTILKILNDLLNIASIMQFPIDLEYYDRREQLKKSGLGKVIMFLSKSDEETTSKRKLAKELVDKWGIIKGLKAYKKQDDSILPFRPEEFGSRMRIGANRICMGGGTWLMVSFRQVLKYIFKNLI
ncbi:hypothetical protein UlMin_004223 [Ulmus minor]